MVEIDITVCPESSTTTTTITTKKIALKRALQIYTLGLIYSAAADVGTAPGRGPVGVQQLPAGVMLLGAAPHEQLRGHCSHQTRRAPPAACRPHHRRCGHCEIVRPATVLRCAAAQVTDDLRTSGYNKAMAN